MIDGKETLLLILLLAAPASQGAVLQWNAATGDWFDAANWTPNQVPVAGDAAFIDNGGTATANGGTLNATTINVAPVGASGSLEVNDATVAVTSALKLGDTTTIATPATSTTTGSLRLINTTVSGQTADLQIGESQRATTADLVFVAERSEIHVSSVDLAAPDASGGDRIDVGLDFTLDDTRLISAGVLDIGEADAERNATAITRVTGRANNSTLVVDRDLDIGDSIADRGGDAFANVDVEFVASTITSLDDIEVGQADADITATATSNVHASFARVNAEMDVFALANSDAGVESLAVSNSNASITDSTFDLAGQFTVSDADSSGGAAISNAELSIVNSSITTNSDFELGESSASNRGTADGSTNAGLANVRLIADDLQIANSSADSRGRVSDTAVVRISDSEFQIMDSMQVSVSEVESLGQARTDSTVSIDRSTVNIADSLTIASLISDAPSPNSHAVADFDATSTVIQTRAMDVAVGAGSQATLNLDQSFIGVADTLILGDVDLSMHIAGDLRASSNNALNGIGLYSALDIGDGFLDGTLNALFDFVPSLDSYTFDLITSSVANGFNGTDFLSTQVTGLDPLFNIAFFGKTQDDFGSGLRDVYRLVIDRAIAQAPTPEPLPLMLISGLLLLISVRHRAANHVR